MLVDVEQGLTLFDGLLRQYPSDGMVYFKRAEAHEALGVLHLAAEDYRRALALFPKEQWKAKAREGLARVTR